LSSTKSFRKSWGQLKTPENPDLISTTPVKGTNAFLTKSHDGSLGLFISEASGNPPKRMYKHLEIMVFPRKDLHVGGKVRKLTNCLMLQADSEVEASALTLILERLFEVAPSGSFSATDVIAVLDEVEELLRKPARMPTLEEVAGAWGELWMVLLMVESANDPRVQRSILSGWEGEVREKIDCRFSHCAVAMEVKTTMSDSRVHHFHGIEQVTTPGGFSQGVLASLIVEHGEGWACNDLLSRIRDAAVGTEDQRIEFSELLDKRIVVRGVECEDEVFLFQTGVDAIAFFDFEHVPVPGQAQGVTPIEWISDLTGSPPLGNSEKEALVSKITIGSGS